MVILAGVLNYVDRTIIAVLKPVISADLHWTDEDYGALASLFQAASAFALLFTGRIADWLGVKLANPVGVIAWSLAAAGHGLARTIPQFAVARMALGASEAMGTPAGIKTINRLYGPDERSSAIGLGNATNSVGAIVAPLFIPAIALAFTWRGAFVAVGLVGLIWSIVWFSTVRGLVELPPAAAEPGEHGSVLRDRTTWIIAIPKLLSDQVWWLLLFWAPDYLHRQFGLNLSQVGAPLAAIYGGAAAGSLLAGFISTRLIRAGVPVGKVRKGVLLVCALLVLPAPLALHVGNYWEAVALIGLMLGAHQGYSVTLFSTIGDIVPAAKVGRVTSFGAFCGNLAGMGIVYAAGRALHLGYGYAPFFYLAAASYIAGVAWMQLLAPRLPVLPPAASPLLENPSESAGEMIRP